MTDQYIPIDYFRKVDQDHSSARIRDMPHGKPRESLVIYPTELIFAETTANTTSAPYPIVITNNGYDKIVIKDLKIVGDFILSGDITTILPGEYVSVSVSFMPRQAGTVTGGLYIDSGDAAGAEFVKLTGTGSGSSLFPYYITRTEFVDAIANGFSIGPGEVVIAEGFSYISEPGSKAIPDLPGFVPWGEIHVEHFGAKADMTWAYKIFTSTSETGASDGPYRLTGTPANAAFIAADNYALKTGKGTIYAEGGVYPNEIPGINGGGYFLDGQFELQGKLVSRRGYRNDLWLLAKSVLHVGIWISSNNGGVVGFRVIDQWTRSQYEIDNNINKPPGHGHCGPGITIASMRNVGGGPGLYQLYVENSPPGIIENIEIDCKFCRAGGGKVAGLPEQISLSAFHFFGAGGIEFCNIKLGSFGHTNTESNGLGICHWGLEYVGGDPNDPIKWYDMDVKRTWHCCDCTFEFLNYHDDTKKSGDGTQGFGNWFELASAGSCRVGDIAVRGCVPLFVGPGDLINHYANPRQKEKIMKGIRGGFIVAVDVPFKASEGNVYPNGSGACFFTRGFGTAKVNNDTYPGTNGTRSVVRQIEIDEEFKGFYLARQSLPPAWNFGRGISVQGCFGKLDLGAVTTYGMSKGVEIEFCDGDQQLNYIQGDGCIMYEFSRGGRFYQTNTDRNVPDYKENPDDGQYRPGIGPGTRAVSVVGGTYSTVVDNSADPINRVNTTTRTWIIPFAGPDDDVYKGTPLKIGNEWVTATEYIQGRSSGSVPIGTITKITNASQAVVTSKGVGAMGAPLRVGMFVGFTGVPGMLITGGPGSINGKSGKVISIRENDFTVALNTSAMSPYGPGTGGNVIPQLIGVPYLDHTPLSKPAAQGAIVMVEEFTRLKQLSLTSAGGETALRMTHASIDNLDMHGLRSAHKYGALLTDARITLKGPLPTTIGVANALNVKNITMITKGNPTMFTVPNHGFLPGIKAMITDVVGMTEMNGRSGNVTVFNANQFTMAINSTAFTNYASGGKATQDIENYTIKGDAKSLFSMSDGSIIDNQRVSQHIIMTKDDVSGAMGHVDLRNCRIENISRLMLGSKSVLRYGLSMHGCTDTQKNQNLSHPARQGMDNDEQYAEDAKGFYHFSDDGMLRCWVRNFDTNPAVLEDTRVIAKGTWWFPARFNAGGDTVVVNGNVTTNTDPTVQRVVRFISGSSTHANIEVIGGVVGTIYTLQMDAIGRYFDE